SKLLAKKPDDRYQTAWEVVAALRDAEQARPLTGELPVVVNAVPMAIAAQSDNVWEGLDASGSSAQALESSTAVPVAPKSDRKKPPREASKMPLMLAGAALVAAGAVLAA